MSSGCPLLKSLDRYLALAEDAADVIWRRGLLRKGNGLCHGEYHDVK